MTNKKVEEIRNLQHERLIHLLVTLFFGLIFMMTMELAIIFENAVLGGVGLGLAVLLVPYIWHYFKLENGVQKKYRE